MIYTKDLLKFSKNLSVLYVEDDEMVRKNTILILETLFGEVQVAIDGKDAIDLYEPNKFDIVITDIRMPHIDGVQMVEIIKETNPNQCIVVISAHNDSDILIELIDLGVDGFALKPIDTDKLIKTLYKISKYINQQKELAEYKEKLENMVDTKTSILQDVVHNLEAELKAKNLELDSLHTILKEQIYIDQLTGCFNNKKFDIDMQDKKSISDEVGNDFSVVLIDIANFQSINNILNRKEANKIIQEFVLIVSKELNEDETLYRYGGVEFVIVSDDTKEVLETKCNKLQHTIKNYNFFDNVVLNINFGIATYTKNRDICLIEEAGKMLSKVD